MFDNYEIAENVFNGGCAEVHGAIRKSDGASVIPDVSGSDLYSMGAALYRLLTGKSPFDTTNPYELMYSHIAKTPTSVFDMRRDIPREVSRVVEKLLKKSPDRRRQTAGGGKRDLLYLKKAALEGNSSREIDDRLDLEALAGTIGALTGDFDSESLLTTLLEAVTRRSGATRAVYLHMERSRGRSRVRAEKRANGDVRIFYGRDAAPESFGLPAALLEKCSSGSRGHILENIEVERKSGEEEPRETRFKSILIIPLKRRRAVMGLVYLENDRIKDAFREDHAQFLTLLAGQVALAMENTLVFERLNAERDYSSNIIENSPGLICEIDGDGITTFVNPAIEKITGYGKDELIGERWWELLHPGEEHEQVERLFNAFAGGDVEDYEMRLTRKDGDKRDIVWNILIRRDGADNITKITGFGADITDLKRAERFRNMAFLVESAASPVAMFTLEGELSHVNPAFLRTWGFDLADEVLGRPISDFWVLGDRMVRITRFMLAEGNVSAEALARRRDGGLFNTRVSGSVVRDDAGLPIALMASSLDITESKRAEKELRRLRNYLSNTIDSMPSMLIGVDPDGKVTQWNREAARAAGVAMEDALGQPLDKAFPRLAAEMENAREAMRTGKTRADSRRTRKEDGETRYEDVSIYPLTSRGAEGVEGAVIRVDDVTGQVRIEETLAQSEKMLSVGGLAAGMAHEINNPLAGMTQNAFVINNRLTNPDMPANRRAAKAAGVSMESIIAFMEARGIIGMLENIRESGARASEIVKNMLSFARKSDSVYSTHDMAGLLDQTANLAGSDYDLKKKYDFRRIEIAREYQEGLPFIPCESGKIQQVILNILSNGAQAMQEAGTVKPMFIFRTRLEKDRDVVRVEIEDNGPGMDAKTRKRVFEPFYTTKALGVGTGLGLSVSYFIITENHGGEMTVESRPGRGAKFIIRLPLERKTS